MKLLWKKCLNNCFRYSLYILLSVMLFSCTTTETEEPDISQAIHGTVVDDSTGEAIEGANISTFPESVTAVTASDGGYSLLDMEAGSYSVIAEKIGYDSLWQQTKLEINEKDTVNFKLHKQPTEIIPVTSWSEISTGVRYVSFESPTTHNIFIGFAGYSVTQANTEHWISELYGAKLNEMGITNIYAVKGPSTASYSSRDLGIEELAVHLIDLVNQIKQQVNVGKIIVAAHSSGSYPAHDLFRYLYSLGYDSAGVTSGKIYYINLDGGTGQSEGVELTQSMADSLAKIYAVYAYDSDINTYSANRSEMVNLAGMFGTKSQELQINAAGSGCNQDAYWCLHMTLINQKPYDPNFYDLTRDYGGINESHPVTTVWLDSLP